MGKKFFNVGCSRVFGRERTRTRTVREQACSRTGSPAAQFRERTRTRTHEPFANVREHANISGAGVCSASNKQQTTSVCVDGTRYWWETGENDALLAVEEPFSPGNAQNLAAAMHIQMSANNEEEVISSHRVCLRRQMRSRWCITSAESPRSGGRTGLRSRRPNCNFPCCIEHPSAQRRLG